MNPLKPTDERNNKADFRIKIDCNGKKVVEVRQKRFEKDRHGKDDKIGDRRDFKEKFDRHDGRVIIHSWDKVDKDRGKDRVYHEVSFRVKSGNNWSDWTKWERSDVATIR